MSNIWGRFFWRPSRFPGEVARPGLVAGAKGWFQAEIAVFRLIRDDIGADRGRSRRASAENSRWAATSLTQRYSGSSTSWGTSGSGNTAGDDLKEAAPSAIFWAFALF